MSMQLGIPILWGQIPDPELPKLPDGWRYEMKPHQWVLAISPKGDAYYVSKDRLYPRRERPQGTFYVDTLEGIIKLEEHGKTG